VIQKGESEPVIWQGKLTRYQMREGDLARLITGTGGGFGDPLERPVKEVQSDVKNGYITVEQARDLYGVELDSNTLEVKGLHAARETE
jgi:N-methylhydantoinase B